MWTLKEWEHIIYIDIERKLTIKPTMLADHTCTPFRDETFSTIFFDPPHGYGKGHGFYDYPDKESFQKRWEGYGDVPRYYGWDKYRNKAHIQAQIYRAQEELYRILKPRGVLWLKWNEVKIPLKNILTLFDKWHELMRLKLHEKVHTAGKKNTYWLCMCKKDEEAEQLRLG